MKIIKVTPRGFCLGVVKSISLAKKAVEQYSNQPIYMLGYLVHNFHIIEEMKKLGIILIDDFKKNRVEILKTIPNNSVVILSAHGSPEEIKNIAYSKKIILIDTECEWVTATKDLIKNYLPTHQIIFIGKHFHPETNAILSISKKIQLVTCTEEIKNIKHNINNLDPILVTNQTTLSQLDINEIVAQIRNTFIHQTVIFKNDLCQATLERQNAILNLDSNEIDLLLVVGDERSSNTLKLVSLGKEKNIITHRISSIDDIKQTWLENINCIAVTAGASTPSIIQNNVIKYLEQL